MKKLPTVLRTLTLPLLLASSLAQATTVKIAVISPLSGPKSGIGVELKRGAEMAVENRIGEFRRGGHVLSLVSLDDQATPTRATFVGNALKNQPQILGAVGALNSGVTNALAEELSKSSNPVALISPTSTNDLLTTHGWKFFSRVVAPDKAQAQAAATYILSTKPKELFIVSDNTTYGNGLSEAVQRELKAKGFKSFKYAGVDTAEQIATLVKRIQQSPPSIVYFGGTDVTGAKLLNALRAAGINTPLVSGDGIYSKAFTDATAKNASGVVFSSAYPLPDALSPAFLKQYKAKYGTAPNSRSAFAYDATNILLDAILVKLDKAGGKGITRADVVAAVRATKPAACAGGDGGKCKFVTGNIGFTSTGERVNSNVYMMKYDAAGNATLLRSIPVSAASLK